jgi:cold shock CspA family protein/predicted RNA-binding Zn-ribbon protein involved in translation (DUF1610 family)
MLVRSFAENIQVRRVMIQRLPCQSCGQLIHPDTAEKTNGVCMPCARLSDAATWKHMSPEQRHRENQSVEQELERTKALIAAANDLVKTAKAEALVRAAQAEALAKTASGNIKWFSKEKGYGYIVGDDAMDYYFNARDVQGADLPSNGDLVNFERGHGKKGLRATFVAITAKGKSKVQSSGRSRPDDRATCPHCGKMMVPRLMTFKGEPQKSLCPFCGGVYKDFNDSSCFIATAVYGDVYAPEVIALRRFRDETLEPNTLGRLFIALYYRLSPPIARFLSRHRVLSAFVRLLLNAIARRND